MAHRISHSCGQSGVLCRYQLALNDNITTVNRQNRLGLVSSFTRYWPLSVMDWGLWPKCILHVLAIQTSRYHRPHFWSIYHREHWQKDFARCCHLPTSLDILFIVCMAIIPWLANMPNGFDMAFPFWFFALAAEHYRISHCKWINCAYICIAIINILGLIVLVFCNELTALDISMGHGKLHCLKKSFINLYASFIILLQLSLMRPWKPSWTQEPDWIWVVPTTTSSWKD